METISGTVTAGITDSGSVSAGGTISGNVRVAGSGPAELFFSDRSAFPNTGREDRLYIASDENMVYRFDATQNAYVELSCAGGDMSEYYTKSEVDTLLEDCVKSSEKLVLNCTLEET